MHAIDRLYQWKNKVLFLQQCSGGGNCIFLPYALNKWMHMDPFILHNFLYCCFFITTEGNIVSLLFGEIPWQRKKHWNWKWEQQQLIQWTEVYMAFINLCLTRLLAKSFWNCWVEKIVFQWHSTFSISNTILTYPMKYQIVSQYLHAVHF